VFTLLLSPIPGALVVLQVVGHPVECRGERTKIIDYCGPARIGRPETICGHVGPETTPRTYVRNGDGVQHRGLASNGPGECFDGTRVAGWS
jgi:hypothetical protein